MKNVDQNDLIGGLMLIAIGAFVALYAGTHYQIGQPARMGPGFFPVSLGCILVGLGVIVSLLAFRIKIHALTPPPFRPRPLVAVLGAVLVFSFIVDRLGLVPATIAMTFVATCAETPYNLKRTAILSVSLSLIAWLIFTVGLQMTLPAFTFFG
ncbi:MAG: tripartite tricarboxylate transporter TctB family protein [Pseudomonadota bacterium]|nr:tripartite tricarboxylate transporter TctB family protein [Pseudomonadota bacterium]